MCRPFGTHLIDLIFPGTSVPGYRLCRPKGLVGHPGLAFEQTTAGGKRRVEGTRFWALSPALIDGWPILRVFAKGGVVRSLPSTSHRKQTCSLGDLGFSSQ